ncbi:MAG: histidine phosphatase family protein [Hyphomicrobium sp.]|nr:histidine phosphatase family protein [Hyphomicrobium sp.]
MRLDLLRHGDTGRSGYLDGATDFPLSETGVRQMQKQMSCGCWPVVIASPLRRAREPAETLARERACELVIDPNWAEIGFGQWDGRHREDLEADPTSRSRLASYYDDPQRQTPPGGECWSVFEKRVHAALGDCYVRAADKPALVVTHAGPIRMALSAILGVPLRSLWAIRVSYGTRVQLEVGRMDDGTFWGELVEIVQP